MPYNKYYTNFEDAQGWQYTLYIIPSNANQGAGTSQLSSLTSFNLVELPDDFLMQDMKLETELGEIPAGLVSQVMTLTCNMAALKDTQSLIDLQACLFQGTIQNGYPYASNGFPNDLFLFARFNTFILMCDKGTGTMSPLFIGCQKYAAENELTVTKLDNVLPLKIECFDILRFICENITGDIYAQPFLGIGNDSSSLDYGNGYSTARNTHYTRIKTGTAYYIDAGAERDNASIDIALDKFSFNVNTFANLKVLIDEMLSQYMRSITWNQSSSVAVPAAFAKAWTFHPPRMLVNDSVSGTIQKPAFISEIYKDNNGIKELKGGALIETTAFGKFKNFYDVFKSLVENTLEIYRMDYSWSYVAGWYSLTYTADYMRPSASAGITFAKSNIYSDVKMKFFQQTVKSAKTSVSTLQSEKDSKVFIYQEGSSSENGKDVELIFHNLPTPTRTQIEIGEYSANYVRNSINSGMITWNDNGTIKKVDSQCTFNYSASQSISLDYTKLTSDNVVLQQILEQRESGVPYTIAYALVKALGDAKQIEVEFDSMHSIVNYSHVGKSCVVNLNDLNSVLTQVYSASTGTGVISKHSLDVYSGKCGITVRMYG